MPGIDAKSHAIYELVEEGSGVEQLATGFTFTEGPIWHPDRRLPPLLRHAGRHAAPLGRRRTAVEVVRDPSQQVQRDDLDADLNLLVCEHVTSSLVRERPDGTRETLASHFEGKELNSPNDVTVRSDGTIYFSDPWYGRMPGFGDRARARARLAGRLPDPARRRRRLELVVGKDEFEHAERALLLARRVAAVHQRHAAGAHQGLRRQRRRHALERPHVLRRHRHRRDRGGHPRRDEVRRARQRLGHRAAAASG